jgi:DNA transformation protein
MENAKSISELKSLGPKSQEMLARAGITTITQLKDLGSVEACNSRGKPQSVVGA